MNMQKGLCGSGKRVRTGCDAKIDVLQCFAVSFECSPLLLLQIMLFACTLTCFCRQNVRKAVTCICACHTPRCSCIQLFKFQWYECESSVCESVAGFGFCGFPLIHHPCLLLLLRIGLHSDPRFLGCVSGYCNTKKSEWPCILQQLSCGKFLCLAITHSKLMLNFCSIFFFNSLAGFFLHCNNLIILFEEQSQIDHLNS